MDRILILALRSLVRGGTLRITTASGRSFVLGDGTGTPVAVRFRSAAAERGILIDPELKLGETYMDGSLVVEEGSIADLLSLLLGQGWIGTPWRWLQPQWVARFVGRHLQQFNARSRARRNVAHHYDLDGRFYTLFLDSDRQYSCAYFERLDQSLDDAQLAKKRHIAAKLRTERGQSILDIGCGWGGLALYLAEFCDARVTGITLSQEQLSYARGRASEKNFGSTEF
ncbi:MAG: class I SAM-dependent methyltransferase, partial [Bradyrhizobiaceae bacterium]|nr:class I SAM-dependent methyltransferase [Bradyrhizobiaceae bacterium]